MITTTARAMAWNSTLNLIREFELRLLNPPFTANAPTPMITHSRAITMNNSNIPFPANMHCIIYDFDTQSITMCFSTIPKTDNYCMKKLYKNKWAWAVVIIIIIGVAYWSSPSWNPVEVPTPTEDVSG